MNDYEKVEMALNILEMAEVIQEFEDSVWVKIDRADWEALWSQSEEDSYE
jgi:hypothetical protein